MRNILILISTLIVVINLHSNECQLVAELPCPIKLDNFEEANSIVKARVIINKATYNGNNKLSIKILNDNIESMNTLEVEEHHKHGEPFFIWLNLNSKLKEPEVIEIKSNNNLVCQNKKYSDSISCSTNSAKYPQSDINPLFREPADICGMPVIPVHLIKQGQLYKAGTWPWLVALFNIPKNSYDCGGSLISHTTVVTAAHCFQNNFNENSYIIGVGAHDLNKPREVGAKFINVKKIIPHSDYRYQTTASYADIALVILDSFVEYKRNVRPICLWNSSEDTEALKNKIGYAAGWGLSDDKNNTVSNIPKYVEAQIVSDTVCFQSNIAFAQLTSNTTFCAGKRDGSGPCVGDSGGGLVIKNGKWFLRGIVSQSLYDQKNTCDLNNYVVYTDVAKLTNWILNNMAP